MKYLDPKNDLIFKKVFGEHPDILRSFLNSMLPLPEGQEIIELEYLSPEMIPETFLEKFTSVDVRCKDNHGRQFLVEMQMNWTTAFKQRVLFNASKAYVTQSDKGFEFKSLKPVYALNLINENYLPQAPEYYHHYAVVHLKDSNERLHGLEFVFIELDKFRAQNIRDKKLQVLWLRFLTEIGEKTEQIDSELLGNPEINKAIQYVMEASLTKEEKLRYEKNWDRISSEKTLLTAAKDEGLEQGLVIGIEKGRVEGRVEGKVEGIEEGKIHEKLNIAKKLMKLGMSPEEIREITGLSRQELDAI
jgi:predicted transposase/invertase (TIGR01784 family)